jgi:hypothetical protein
MPVQFNLRDEMCRAWLLVGEPYPGCADHKWETVLGVPLDARIRLVFFLFVWAAQNQGVIDRRLLDAPNMKAAIDAAGGRDGVELVMQDLSTTKMQFRNRDEEERRGRATMRRTDFNPLVRYPLIEQSTELYVVPSLPLLLQTVFTYGLYYRGIEAWGNGFSDDLGARVEAYTGANLGMVRGATVIPEIRYGKSQNRSVEWIIVFDECVVLVECKSARVGLEALQSPDGEKAVIERYIARAASQIDKTAECIMNQIPGFESVPSDRPILGIVVTPEEIMFANLPIDRFVVPSRIPFDVLSLRDLDALATVETEHIGELLVRHFENRDPLGGNFISELRQSTRFGRHPGLEGAWSRFAFAGEVASSSDA